MQHTLLKLFNMKFHIQALNKNVLKESVYYSVYNESHKMKQVTLQGGMVVGVSTSNPMGGGRS